jgi:2',3'-cyclic-nucleotide 2'-phosphodiesterase (5'-nucleotidase family)
VKRLKVLVALGLTLLLAAALAAGCPPTPQSLVVLHFNDFHGQVQPVKNKDGSAQGGLDRLAGLADAIRADDAGKHVPTLLLNAGDILTGTAFSTLFRGKPEFHVLGLMRLTAMTPGNHEWDCGATALETRARDASFPLLVANLKANDPARVFWKPFATFTVGHSRIGIIGVTTPDTPLTTAPGNTKGFTFTDPVAAVGNVLGSIGPRQWDFVIVLSHCGFDVDRKIAHAFPQIGLIVGGHDHKVIEKPWIENGVPIVQAGDRGRFLGRVTVTLRRGRRPAVAGTLIPVLNGTPASGDVARYIAPFLAREQEELGTFIARLPRELSGDRNLLRTAEAPIGDLITDGMRRAASADAAFLNGGTVRAGLPAGAVTQKDLYGCLPYFDSLHTTRLTGEQIQALLDRCASMPSTDPPGGFLQMSGISVTYRRGNARHVLIGGKPLDLRADYLVACTNFLCSGGDGLVEFTQGRDIRDWGISIQDILRREIGSPDIKIPTAGKRIHREALAKPIKKAS